MMTTNNINNTTLCHSFGTKKWLAHDVSTKSSYKVGVLTVKFYKNSMYNVDAKKHVRVNLATSK